VRFRHVLAGQRKLLIGDINPDDGEPLRESLRRRDAGATSKVEHLRPVAQARHEVIEEAIPGITFDAGGPLPVALAERIVASANYVRPSVDACRVPLRGERGGARAFECRCKPGEHGEFGVEPSLRQPTRTEHTPELALQSTELALDCGAATVEFRGLRRSVPALVDATR
jgi:hypothetical protein